MSDQPIELVSTDETVQLTVPASTPYASILRTVTASLAAKRDFTIEEIDDLRIAVDEACALLLPFADEGSGQTLLAIFSGPDDLLQVTVSLSSPPPFACFDETSFAWLVLSAVADEVSGHTSTDDDRLTVSFSKSRHPRG